MEAEQIIAAKQAKLGELETAYRVWVEQREAAVTARRAYRCLLLEARQTPYGFRAVQIADRLGVSRAAVDDHVRKARTERKQDQ